MRFPRLVWDKSPSQQVEKLADEAGFRIDDDILPSSQVRNVAPLGINRRKTLPRLPSKRRYWAYIVISIVLFTGIVVGTTLGVMKGQRPGPADSAAQTTVTVIVNAKSTTTANIQSTATANILSTITANIQSTITANTQPPVIGTHPITPSRAPEGTTTLSKQSVFKLATDAQGEVVTIASTILVEPGAPAPTSSVGGIGDDELRHRSTM